jgi:polysaccharide export outer membrane protein
MIVPLILTVSFLLACAQQAGLNQEIQHRSFNAESSMRDYRLGPGDLIGVSVFGVERFNQTVRISLSGKISIPYLGKVPAAGLTGAQLEKNLARLISDSKLILNPQVSVFIKEYRSQPVYVLGTVKNPGQYMIMQPLKLIDVIAMAGGLDLDKSGDYALLQRRGKASSPQQPAVDSAPNPGAVQPPAPAVDRDTVQIKVKDLMEGGDPRLNLPVQGGDVVQIPERKREIVYIIGEVRQPGAYELPPDRHQVLLTQAIARAGGPQEKTAKFGKGIVLRYDEQGKREEIAVNWKEILKGKKPDFLVRADDVIFIPPSNSKTITYGLLGMIPSSVGSALSYSAYRF